MQSEKFMLDRTNIPWVFWGCLYIHHLKAGGHTDFGADPVGVGIGITLSCLHNILWTSGWILTKFSWIYNWYITKNWLDFDDLDLIFTEVGNILL